MARPKTKPPIIEGRYTYVLLGGQWVAFPTDCATARDKLCLQNIMTSKQTLELTADDHFSLQKLLRNHGWPVVCN